MQPSSPKRIFVGFSLDKPQTEKILLLQQALKHSTDNNSLPALAHNLHLTLGFIGTVDPTTYTDILAAIDKMPKTRFSQIVDTLDWWQTAKLICLKGQTCPSLHTMATAMREIAERHQQPKNQYDYIPHISLFHDVKVMPLLKIEQYTRIVLEPTFLHLYQSNTQHNKVNYTILKSWPLIPFRVSK